MIPLGILSQGVVAAGAFDLLETQILTSSASSVTFTGLGTLAAGYQHLQLRMTGRVASNFTGDGATYMIFNGTTGLNDLGHYLRGDGSTVTSKDSGDAVPYWVPKNLEDSGAYMSLVMDILDFSSTTKNTTARALWGNVTTNSEKVGLSSGALFQANALTTLGVTSNGANWVAGSRFSLYGVKG